MNRRNKVIMVLEATIEILGILIMLVPYYYNQRKNNKKGKKK